MKDLVYLLGAAAVGAVAWEMYNNGKKRNNPDPDAEMARTLEQKIAALDNSGSANLTRTGGTAAPVQDDKYRLLEQRLSNLEHRARKNPPRRRFIEEDEEEFYDED